MKDTAPEFYPAMGGFTHVLHGGDYNPDQWQDSPTILEEDARLMKIAGVNVATLNVFAWTALEREEGTFSFEWLDDSFARLHSAGVRIVLATPSGARPAWMDRKYPEIMRINSRREKELHGQRENHCYTSPIFRRLTATMNEKLAQRYGKHPALLAWHVSNEFCGECHCPQCQVAFRDWLKKKYKNLEALNKAWWSTFWSHTFTDWEEIESPSPVGENLIHGLNLDWKRFVTYQTVDFYKGECEPLRRLTPAIPITVNMMGTYPGLDYWQFAPHVDFISWDAYPSWHTNRETEAGTGMSTAFLHDLNRSLKGGRPFILMESTPSLVNWQDVCKLKRPGMHTLSSLQAVAHGSDAVMYFQWRKSRGASEKFHGAVVDHEGTENTRVFREVAALGELLPQLKDVVGTTVRPQVAIIYDWENRWAIEDLAGLRRDKRDYQETVLSHYQEFWKRGIPVDVVNEDAALERYDLVIAPMLYMVRKGVGEHIAGFVKKGGTLVTSYLTGYVNDSDLCFLGGFPGGKGSALREALGIWAEEIDTLYDGQSNSLASDPSSPLGLAGSFKVKEYCEIVHTEKATVAAVYENDFYAGSPALTVNSYGKGEAWHIASRTESDFLDAFYEKLIPRAGIEKLLETELPEGVTVQLRTDGKKRFYFLSNFSARNTVVGLGTLTGTELLSGEKVKNALELSPWGVAVIQGK